MNLIKGELYRVKETDLDYRVYDLGGAVIKYIITHSATSHRFKIISLATVERSWPKKDSIITVYEVDLDCIEPFKVKKVSLKDLLED